MTAKDWQLVEITGVGIGEMWYDLVEDELTENNARRRAARNKDWHAVPMPRTRVETTETGGKSDT